MSADIVVTTTPSTTPLVNAEWLIPGQHITAMGSDQAHKNELAPACLARADLYVPDRRSQTEEFGELHHALAAGVVAEDAVFPELGELVSGQAPGRPSPEAITICDLTGTGLQDTAIATFAASEPKQPAQAPNLSVRLNCKSADGKSHAPLFLLTKMPAV